METNNNLAIDEVMENVTNEAVKVVEINKAPIDKAVGVGLVVGVGTYAALKLFVEPAISNLIAKKRRTNNIHVVNPVNEEDVIDMDEPTDYDD